MFAHRSYSSAEKYNVAAKQAEQLVPGHHNVRRNHMSAAGNLALSLARVGAGLIKPTSTEFGNDKYSLFPDYVGAGASLSFSILQRVIDPASRLYGPGNFSITPCDAAGNELATDGGEDGMLQFDKLAQSRTIALGGEREDYWQAMVVGIASEVADRGVSPKRASKLAESLVDDGGKYAHAALASAARYGLEVVQANQAQLAEHVSADSSPLSVIVKPHTGYALEVVSSLGGAITL